MAHGQAGDDRGHTQLAQEFFGARAVEIVDFGIAQFEVKRYISIDASELLAQLGHSAAFFQFGARRVGRNLGEVLVEVFDRTECFEQFRGGFLADTRHARDVVRGVAAQGFAINNLRRGQAVAAGDGDAVKECRWLEPPLGEGDFDLPVYELERVAVAGEDDNLGILQFLGDALGQSADNVIGFIALNTKTRYLE